MIELRNCFTAEGTDRIDSVRPVRSCFVQTEFIYSVGEGKGGVGGGGGYVCVSIGRGENC